MCCERFLYGTIKTILGIGGEEFVRVGGVKGGFVRVLDSDTDTDTDTDILKEGIILLLGLRTGVVLLNI